MLQKDSQSGALVSDSTFDLGEVARFDERSRECRDPAGKFGIIHAFNAVRRDYVIDAITRPFGGDPLKADALAGIRLLDIGCGAGVLAEPLAARGASIVAIDASAASIDLAQRHAQSTGRNIDYRHCLAKDVLDAGQTFDVVLNTEVVEHVADQGLFLRQGAALTAPGGLHLVATLNRTAKAWLLAIIGAEFVLRWLPRGTHAWSKFVQPSEARAALTAAGLSELETVCIVYDALRRRWRLFRDTHVNYMMLAERLSTADAGAETMDPEAAR
jgi:2-polyprenyl-6-hydroxyphenyl methylase/3-demethylubiquinone-9 3-methyltransferase